MTEVYALWKGPTYQPLSPNDMMADALNQPMGFLDTLSDQFIGGVLDSPLAGTAIRESMLPDRIERPPGRRMALEDMNLRAQREADYENRLFSKDDYQASPYFRTDIPWDNGMTKERAAALALEYDAKKVRQYFASKRPYTAFIGSLAGQAVDPINYVPVAGPAVKGAAVLRLGRLGGEIAAASADAMSNTALGALASYRERQSLGDDITWQSTVSEIAMAGLIGAAFGGIHGAINLYREGKAADRLAARQKEITEQLSTLENTQNARIALNEAIDNVVRGEDVNLSPNSIEPIARIADELNPAFRPYTLGKVDRADLFSGVSLDQILNRRPVSVDLPSVFGPYSNRASILDRRPTLVQDFEEAIRQQVFDAAPDIATKYQAAQGKFTAAAAKLDEIEAPLNARRQSDTVRLIDEESAIRLAAVEEELAKTIPAPRRAQLEAERDSIVESIGPDVLAKAEKDFRIGPEKRLKEARKSLATARQQFAKVSAQVDTAGKTLMAARRPAFQTRIDTSVAKPDAPPAGIKEAAARMGKVEDTRALAEQFGVNPQDGSFVEQADIDQVRQEGRLTEEDEADLTDADTTFENSVAFGEALRAAVACLI